ncbi:TetR family transcriptional regulator [Conexibacter stalactiti]|uniref:TetR family transcriptional regulator n=1 Tax=Conexibacter stalactiti TaxID=1940611 RepID=A0ABU4HSG7_9ACTN|nr:TetR family transcriptional regulator [Conexibacter stalactiti]MDW5595679.1 TetR family transcriptional regulator [Conexibacter stalactiti]MEC5036321.1 TetR family transcriptional regulator [Conexibacter stalactiti]
MPVERPYRGIPADARVADRRERLLAAARAEIAAGGVAALSVRAICTRAGLTRRYFYESFSDLDALLLAAFDALHAEIADAVVGALAQVREQPFDVRARAAIGAGLEVVVAEPAKARLLVAAGGEHGALAARRAEAVDAFATLVAAELPGPPEARSPIAARMVTGGLIETVDAWLRGVVPLDEEGLIAEAARLASALAGAAGGAAESSGR